MAAIPVIEREVLRCGTPIELRAMQPDDADRLVRFHATLSAETTYLRYFSPHPELRDSEIDRFTHVDHLDREAVVATLDGEIIAVGRFDRVAGTDTAEVAFVVADAWHHQGIGRILFEQLAMRAREVGVTRFSAETLWQNRPMLALFHNVGRPVTSRAADGVVHLEIELEPCVTG